MGKQSICLSMIVKNEAAVIRRCLESVKPLIGCWTIDDTGSTDDTKRVILDALQGVPGEFASTKWVDFATNRNLALARAMKTGADYVLTLDADEAIALGDGADGSFPHLTADGYDAAFRLIPDGRTWHRKLMVRADKPWTYRYPIHECLVLPGATVDLLGGLEVHSFSDGDRNTGPDACARKSLRDAKILERCVRKEPNEPRYWYYLGQSYAGAGLFRKAYRAYERRTELEGWDEERWYALYQLAPLRGLMGYHWRDVLAAYLTAFTARPWRAEPLWAAGNICMNNGEPALAEAYLRQACRLPLPSDSLLVDEKIYAWRSADDLAYALASLGRGDDCVGVLERLSNSKDLPPAELPRILENISTAREKLAVAA